MEIMAIIIIGIILIFIVIFTAMHYLSKAHTPVIKERALENKKPVTEPTEPNPEVSPLEDIPTNSGFVADDPTASFKENIHAHIERIISLESQSPRLDFKPLVYSNVDKQVLNDVMVHVKELKNFRSYHHRLHKILNDPTLQLGTELSKMVTSDPVLTAKILNTVNAPYFGLPQKINSIGHALLLIGIVHIREILYRNGLLQLFVTKDPVQNEIVDNLWKHLTLTSICAAHLQSGLFHDLDRGTLFTMGLLHDMGKLIMLRWLGADRYSPKLSLLEEDQSFGINHCVVGRMALENWGFSDLMIITIEHHHMPSLIDQNLLTIDAQRKRYLVTLFLADQLAKLILHGDGTEKIPSLHPSYAGMIDRLNLIRNCSDGVLFTSIIKSEVFAAPV